jgi:reactive intermediate/imine deaminase
MSRSIIATDKAPAAIGPYSQAVRAGNTVYFSGQIPLDPATGNMIEGSIVAQTRRVFDNLKAVAEAAGGSLDQIVRVGIYVTNLGHFAEVNAVMAEYFHRGFRLAQAGRRGSRCHHGARLIHRRFLRRQRAGHRPLRAGVVLS